MKPLIALLLLAARLAPGGDLRQVSIDLDEIREGDLPREIFVIDGSFQIKIRESGKVIEISGEQAGSGGGGRRRAIHKRSGDDRGADPCEQGRAFVPPIWGRRAWTDRLPALCRAGAKGAPSRQE